MPEARHFWSFQQPDQELQRSCCELVRLDVEVLPGTSELIVATNVISAGPKYCSRSQKQTLKISRAAFQDDVAQDLSGQIFERHCS